jgi:dolichyl-phosphooligosaccharide-protein glycotransferase
MSKITTNPSQADLSKSKEKAIAFFKKNGIILLILIPLIAGAYIRFIPKSLPITDNWAKQKVDNYYKANIASGVRQQYPNLPDQNINSLVEQRYSDFYHKNKANIAEQIRQTSAQFKKSFQMESGYNYMFDFDPYTFLRYAENYLNHGYIGDEIRNGTQYDNHMIAPKGTPLSRDDPFPKLLAYLYRVMHFFNSKITVMESSAYQPVIFAVLAIIPVFFIGSMFAGSVGGFFAALILAINGAFIGRTLWGHADTDALNIMFPMYAVWFFFIAIKNHDWKKTATFAALSGLMFALFNWFWSGWWYAFDLLLGMIGFYLAYLLIFEHKFSLKQIIQHNKSKTFLLASFMFILSSGVFVSLLTSPQAFVDSLTGPLGFSTIKSASHVNLWPNVYTTVAELDAASFDTIITSIGGRLFFYISLMGIALLFLKKKEGRREYLPYALLLALWFTGMFYASGKGIRFTMMLVPPLALGMGATFGIVYRKIIEYLEKLKIPKKVTATVLIILFLLLLLPHAKGVAESIKNDIPFIDDAWWNSLTKIKTESQPNAIINSWWDFGHPIKYVADRAVTFDGASQNSPMAHWIGKTLLTSDEKQAIGILRMLDCGSNDAFDVLVSVVNDTPQTIDMLNEIILMDKTRAKSSLLSKKIDEKTANRVLELTHCNPPEDYFITSGDMLGKGASWAHFGSWDFNRADLWIDVSTKSKDEAMQSIKKQLHLNEEDAKKRYYEIRAIETEQEANAWIAPWPGYSHQIACSIQSDVTLICGGISIDLATKDVRINSDRGIQKPYSIVYSENDEFFEKKFDNGVQQSIMLMRQGDGYKIMVASPEVAVSTFTKLYFYDGAGMKQFKKFDDQSQITGEKVIVWKVQW